MRYDICLFDLDGTLSDPKLGIPKSFQYALESFGIHEELDKLVKFIGPPLRSSFRESYGMSEADTEIAVTKFREYLGEKGLYENEIYSGIPEALQKLKESGIKLAVVTSKASIFAERAIEYFKLGNYFALVSGDTLDGGLTKNGKRDLINIALDSLDPERKLRAVMIGDRKDDIHGALDAGIENIGVLWGYGSEAELRTAGAGQLAESVGALCRFILGE